MCAASPMAFASSVIYIQFTALPLETGNGTTNSQSGTYDGESTATINGISDEYLVCDDFTNTTVMPSGIIDFSANTISSLTSSDVDFSTGFATVSGTTLTQIQAYDTVAVLTTELEALTANSGNAQSIADFQYAIWDLMLPGTTEGGTKDSPLDSNATTDLQNAFAQVKASSPTAQTLADEASLVIYTPTSGYSSNQEFVGLNTPTSTPEPSSWILLAGFGLLLWVPQLRSRLSAARARI